MLLRGTPVSIVKASWVGHVSEDVLKLDTHVFDGSSAEAMKRLAKANLGRGAGANRPVVAGEVQHKFSTATGRLEMQSTESERWSRVVTNLHDANGEAGIL